MVIRSRKVKPRPQEIGERVEVEPGFTGDL
jgi:hypothetical protein